MYDGKTTITSSFA